MTYYLVCLYVCNNPSCSLKVVKNPMAVRNDAEPVTLNVELKKMASLLGADHIGSRGCTAHFIREKLLHISLIRDDVSLEYYLPGVQV